MKLNGDHGDLKTRNSKKLKLIYSALGLNGKLGRNAHYRQEPKTKLDYFMESRLTTPAGYQTHK
jgi:hypothetical protein